MEHPRVKSPGTEDPRKKTGQFDPMSGKSASA
jgi:hypothetical protein